MADNPSARSIVNAPHRRDRHQRLLPARQPGPSRSRGELPPSVSVPYRYVTSSARAETKSHNCHRSLLTPSAQCLQNGPQRAHDRAVAAAGVSGTAVPLRESGPLQDGRLTGSAGRAIRPRGAEVVVEIVNQGVEERGEV